MSMYDLEVNNFCTGSSFIGQFDMEGKMTGFGIYRYPDGTEYRGLFKRGLFHGRGMLIHPNKFKLCGNFVNGNCDDYKVYFDDGLEYRQDMWNYCIGNDRRFWQEIVSGISPVGQTFLTRDKPARRVPSGMFDIGEGFFDPSIDFVIDPETGHRTRYVCPEEKTEIIRTNRMNTIDYKELTRKEEGQFMPRDIDTDSLVSADSK